MFQYVWFVMLITVRRVVRPSYSSFSSFRVFREKVTLIYMNKWGEWYRDFARIVLIAVGRYDGHNNAFARIVSFFLVLLERPHFLSVKDYLNRNMAPADCSSVKTVRTVIDTHLVVYSIQSELSFGDSVCISIMKMSMKSNLPTVAP